MSSFTGSSVCLVLIILNLAGSGQSTFFVPHIGITNGGLGIHQGHLPGLVANNGGGGSAFSAGGGAAFNGGSQAGVQGSDLNAGFHKSVNAGGAVNVNGGAGAQGQEEVNGANAGGVGRHSVNAGGAAGFNAASSSSYKRVYESRVVNGGSHGHAQGQAAAVNGGVKNGPPCP